MEYLIGLILSVAVAGFATLIGFDRERVFYPTVLIVIAFYYVLFAAAGASGRTLLIEIAIASWWPQRSGSREISGSCRWLCSDTEFLTFFIASSSSIREYLVGGRVFAWRVMWCSPCG